MCRSKMVPIVIINKIFKDEFENMKERREEVWYVWDATERLYLRKKTNEFKRHFKAYVRKSFQLHVEKLTDGDLKKSDETWRENGQSSKKIH